VDGRLADRRQHGLERREVAVDVGEDGDSHGDSGASGAPGTPEAAVYRRAVAGRSSSTWVRIGVTAVAAVVVAEAAAWLLRPRDIEQPVHADENSYFSHDQLTKARDYASGQRLLLVGGLVAEGAVLVLLA